ncbi:MAG: carboxypeptidase regulatory-like domain-containing protein, partial [Acidobacteria bacterium]|nr:carboxypeptidase regulatory-like domain-containing protein [Acidobacteriota bacterium]
MKQILGNLTVILAMLFIGQFAVEAQTTGSIAGTVIDQNGAVVPNATVTVTGEGGQEFTVTTSENGTYRIPAVANGIYTVSVTSTGFKKSIVSNVKVDVGSPTTVDSTLEVGDVAQTVEITSGGEVLQTQTATVGTTITGRQITETPIASRDALDLVGLLPGTATVGRPRSASINGLPKGSLSITIDGVDVQDNLLRSSDGYFTYVRPRIDAIDEVTVSTANPGAESSGDGAVQIKFVTKRGTNDYRGGLFWQHRNTDLNAAYWYNNRDLALLRDANGKAPRNKIILNQYGGRFGGPLPFLNFGDRGGPVFNSGKDKAFFFFNYEQFRQPESQSRTRTVLTPEAQAGNFSYITSSGVQTRNLFTIAAANNRLSTPDPTISALLTRIRTAATGAGTFTPITNNPNRQNFNFTPAGGQVRKFLALRFDFNLTKNHSLEFVTNRQKFVPSKDFLNAQEERFPGFPSYTQGSDRNSYAAAVRSTFGNNIVNEARYAVSTGFSSFSPGISPDDFGFQGGFDLSIGGSTV